MAQRWQQSCPQAKLAWGVSPYLRASRLPAFAGCNKRRERSRTLGRTAILTLYDYTRRTIVSGELKEHSYQISLQWTGNTGQGTANYKAYDRAYEIVVPGKPKILGSSDPAFRGDKTKYNPEELLVASLSSCHMLWYLHLCAEAGVIVISYCDSASGKMCQTKNGGGRFTEVILKPEISITAESNLERARQLHHQAHDLCFIANSVNFPVLCQPSIVPKA